MPTPGPTPVPAAFIEAGLAVAGIAIAPEWKPQIAAIFAVVLDHMDRVESFALPDEAEAAAVFEA
jgi:hypothetical protein